MIGHPQEFTTTQGGYWSDEIIFIAKLSFPQFCKSRVIPNMVARVFDSPTSQYNIILGRNVLSYSLVLDHGTRKIAWDGLSIPMVSLTNLIALNERLTNVGMHYQCAMSVRTSHAAAARKISNAKYEPVSPNDIIALCPHLMEQNRVQLKALITKFQTLFSGKLGQIKIKPSPSS